MNTITEDAKELFPRIQSVLSEEPRSAKSIADMVLIAPSVARTRLVAAALIQLVKDGKAEESFKVKRGRPQSYFRRK